MINVNVIPHIEQRYDTVGDWEFWEAPKYRHGLTVRVSQSGHEATNILVAIHEIIEAYLCKANAVSGGQVDAWDKDHLDSPDPGSIPGCPYYREHMFATMIERAMAAELNIDWDEHEARLEAL